MRTTSEARTAYLQGVLDGLGTVIVTYQNYGYHPLLEPLRVRCADKTPKFCSASLRSGSGLW